MHQATYKQRCSWARPFIKNMSLMVLKHIHQLYHLLRFIHTALLGSTCAGKPREERRVHRITPIATKCWEDSPPPLYQSTSRQRKVVKTLAIVSGRTHQQCQRGMYGTPGMLSEANPPMMLRNYCCAAKAASNVAANEWTT